MGDGGGEGPVCPASYPLLLFLAPPLLPDSFLSTPVCFNLIEINQILLFFPSSFVLFDFIPNICLCAKL